MAGSFDDQTLDIPCQHCGHKMPETVRRLKADPKLTCPKCGNVTEIEAAPFRQGPADVDKAIDNLKRSFSKFGKRSEEKRRVQCQRSLPMPGV